MVELLSKIKKTITDLTQKFNRKPTNEEIANYLNVELDKVQTVMDISQAITSLDTPVDDDGETSISDLVADCTSENPGDNLIKEANSQIINEVFTTLSNREAEILKMRFGINTPKAMTLEEIGDHFGLTRERIRQIEGKAIRKLRHPLRARMLKEAMI